CAIDQFADADTRQYAAETLALNRFALDELLAAARPWPTKPLVYGSGLDTRPDCVASLSAGRTLFGNTPATLRYVHTPHRFFALLVQLGIPHPATRFTPPDSPKGWLVKPSCGEGGKRVGFAAKNRPVADTYYQRHIDSPACSLLFLADGRTARPVGFNTQWTASHDAAQPFLFSGAINRAVLDAAQRQAVADYASRLTAALDLVGLNSLDFVCADGECLVLEVNPRPSATMALYDADYPQGLLAAHLAACRGERPAAPTNGPARAMRIVYAPQDIAITENFVWPQGCADIPNAAATFSAGQPLCSLLAEGGDPAAATARLDALENRLAALWHDAPAPNF
ncbi:MAG: ATP-grasp domain-containing protein, partial [Candidatus Methylumidiphilus sp.]